MLCIMEARTDTSHEESLPRSLNTAISNWRYCHVSESPDGHGPFEEK